MSSKTFRHGERDGKKDIYSYITSKNKLYVYVYILGLVRSCLEFVPVHIWDALGGYSFYASK